MYTPLNPTFISKNWLYRGIPIFLIFAQNIDYGYSLEPPRRKNIKIFPLKIFIFYSFKNLFILHGHVFVMLKKIILSVADPYANSESEMTP